MYFTTVLALLSATAIAAPTNTWAAPVTDDFQAAPLAARGACNSALQLFKNPGFNGTASEWKGSGDSGVKGAAQTTYFPVSYPVYGGPSAYAVSFTIPANQTKKYTVQQPITLGAQIRDDGAYTMGLNTWISGTSTAKCTTTWFAGNLGIFPAMSTMPKPGAAPGSWFYNAANVNVYGNPGLEAPFNENAGFTFTCTAGNETANVVIYLDNASLIDTCD